MPTQPVGEDGAGRYETILRVSEGGMGTVYVGTVRGALGFRQLVAIKRPHAHLLSSSALRSAFVKEARLASLIHHANVVDVRDVVVTADDVYLVMDYVEGASLAELARVSAGRVRALPAGVAVRIVLDACAGLHAAHELTDERGRPLNLVHRDISPHNLLVGSDGVTRVADFGVAKFNRTTGSRTSAGHVKGKLAYAAPECLRGEVVDRQVDVFAMGVVLWEVLTGERLFRGRSESETMRRIMEYRPPPVSSVVPALGSALDSVLDMALAKSREARFVDILAMASGLESAARGAGLLAGHREVVDVVRAAVGDELEERRRAIRARLADEPSIASAQTEPTTAETPGGAPALAPNAAPSSPGLPSSAAGAGEQTDRTVTFPHPAVARHQPIALTTLKSESLAPSSVAPGGNEAVSPRSRRLWILGVFALLCVAGLAVAWLRMRGAR